MKTGWLFRSFIAGIAVGLLAASAYAQGPQPLPEFKVKSTQGADQSSSTLLLDSRGSNVGTEPPGTPPRPYQWLLIYVSPNCPQCQHILHALQEKTVRPLVKDRVVVVVGDLKPANVKLMTKQFPWVTDSSWFLDTAKEAFKKLNLKSDAVVLGMRDQNIQWKLVGQPKDSSALDSIMTTWIIDKK